MSSYGAHYDHRHPLVPKQRILSAGVDGSIGVPEHFTFEGVHCPYSNEYMHSVPPVCSSPWNCMRSQVHIYIRV